MIQLVLVVAMVALVANVLKVPLPKYHDGDDRMTHVKQLTHVCIYMVKIYMSPNSNTFQTL